MKRLRVLITLDDLHVGGISNLLLKTLPVLGEVMHIELLYFGTSKVMQDRFQQAGISVTHIPYKGKIFLLPLLVRLTRFIRRGKFDIIHSHLFMDIFFIGLVSPFIRCKIVTTLHSAHNPFQEKRSIYRKIILAIDNGWRRYFYDIHVAVSSAAAQSWVQFRRLPADKIQVIYSGILPLKSSCSDKPQNRTLQQPLVLATCCRLDPVKGLPRLITYLAALNTYSRDWKMIIVGSGLEYALLNDLINHYGLADQVVMPGYCEDVSGMLSKAHFYVNSSYTEAMPIAVIEAMSLGLPIIGSAVGGIPEIISDGYNGYLIDYNQPNEFINCLRSIFSLDNDAYQKMCTNALQRYSEKFSIKQYQAGICHLYQSLAG